MTCLGFPLLSVALFAVSEMKQLTLIVRGCLL
jgi:hypothetical protein